MVASIYLANLVFPFKNLEKVDGDKSTHYVCIMHVGWAFFVFVVVGSPQSRVETYVEFKSILTPYFNPEHCKLLCPGLKSAQILNRVNLSYFNYLN